MEFYLEEKITPKLIRSPFREDNSPTCGFYYGSTGRLYLHDFGTDEHMDCIEIVKKKYNFSYSRALDKIMEDSDKFKTADQVNLDHNKKLEYVLGDEQQLNYFDQYFIKKSTLLKYKVFPARTVYTDEAVSWRSTERNPIFVYLFESGRIKAYRPLSPDRSGK